MIREGGVHYWNECLCFLDAIPADIGTATSSLPLTLHQDIPDYRIPREGRGRERDVIVEMREGGRERG